MGNDQPAIYTQECWYIRDPNSSTDLGTHGASSEAFSAEHHYPRVEQVELDGVFLRTLTALNTRGLPVATLPSGYEVSCGALVRALPVIEGMASLPYCLHEGGEAYPICINAQCASCHEVQYERQDLCADLRPCK